MKCGSYRGEDAARRPASRLLCASHVSGSATVRRDFHQLWRAKWQGGGFFHRRGLARVAARHGSAPLARLARAIMGLELGPPWSRWLTDSLLDLLRNLSPEVSRDAVDALDGGNAALRPHSGHIRQE